MALPRWTLRTSGLVAPDERLPWGQTAALGVQHVFAMFGATVLAPVLMGFDPNVAILFSGVGTLIFFAVVGGRVPSYLGSSFAYIAVVIAATGYTGQGPNPNIGVALGGIMASGVLYAAIAVVVMFAGHGWIERVMPPVVTGAVVAVIGLNLAPVAIRQMSGSGFDVGVGVLTILAVGAVAVYAPGALRRLPIVLGGLVGYSVWFGLSNGLGWGAPIDFSGVAAASWIGVPRMTSPVFRPEAMTLIAPVAIVLVAENLGHVKAVAAMTGRNLDRYLGRAFLGDALATIVAASRGGTGVTTYAENIGVMAVTRVYSTLLFIAAALFAIAMGFSPKFGAVLLTIPPAVLGGVSVVLFGLIAATGGRIWVENRVNFSSARNLVTAGVTLVLGAGDFSVKIGAFSLGGIGTATLAAIVLYQLLAEREPQPEEGVGAEAAAPES